MISKLDFKAAHVHVYCVCVYIYYVYVSRMVADCRLQLAVGSLKCVIKLGTEAKTSTNSTKFNGLSY